MYKIVTTDEMRKIEQAADASGLSYDQMMQNAGKTIAESILEYVGIIEGKRVVILVGTGNNGGDGLVVSHHLHEAGAQVAVYQTKERPSDDPNLKRLQEVELLIANAGDDQRSRVLKNLLETADIVVDGILGTGFQLPLKGSAKALMAASKKILDKREVEPFIVAVDCPSGLDCDSGEMADETLHAHLTVTLAAAKPGLFRFPGAAAVGEIVVGDIGIDPSQKEISSVKMTLAEDKELSSWLPSRPQDAHKGTFGRVMVVAGSINFPGAAGLSGLAAYRVGAGLVTMAVPSVIQPLVAPLLPEATWIILPHEIGVISENAIDVIAVEFGKTEALVIGPGFGLEKTTKTFLSRLFGIDLHSQRGQIGFVHPESVEHEKPAIPPCIIDADGLKLLSQFENWYTFLPENSILTPHPGEMAGMTGLPKEEIQEDRVEIVKQWAKMWGHIIVLKGAFTVVAAPGGEATIIPVATPALARAGTGDVLAGAIAGFRAQGVDAYQAAILGSYVHARAGEFAAEIIGTTASVLAGDVADALSSVIVGLENL
ncbi:MAG: NAD(P)H-hydrate dehydratase [Candidatus Hermodarchaeota archaeon]|nr:NAD(P)H-hydrate dehydratase [Candidatus Hermodarchaeota archaeon]